jgi:hypothetical protein
VAKRVRWDLNSLVAPAGKTFQVELENLDGAPELHNFVVAVGTAAGPRLFSGGNFRGPATRTYDVPGLPAGSYVFTCSIHADVMTGDLTVK